MVPFGRESCAILAGFLAFSIYCSCTTSNWRILFPANGKNICGCDIAMATPIISVRNIGKKYCLGFTHEGKTYKTLRDTITHGMRRIVQSAKGKAGSGEFNNPITQSDNNSITKSHNNSSEFWALKDISFDVQQGEVLGIIGANGAGKSTMLKILSEITEPTEGEIRVRGRVASLLEVGTGFHPELSGRENVYMNGAILGMTKSEINAKFDEIIAFAEVERFIDTPVKRYSSGMQVRLAFAVAAHMEPEILLVDEVLAVGDVGFQKKCLGKMRDIKSGGRTVIFVSHNMGMIRKLCSRAILLEKGRKVMDGEHNQVIASYLRALTANITVDVDLPPGDGDAPGEAKRLRFFSENGKPQVAFRLYERWSMVLEFEIYRSVAQVIAAVGLVNFDSVPIITYWSKPRDLEPGRYLVRFQCDAELKSCDLTFAAGLSSRENPIYFVNSVGHVMINEVAMGKQPHRSLGAGLLLSKQDAEIFRLEL